MLKVAFSDAETRIGFKAHSRAQIEAGIVKMVRLFACFARTLKSDFCMIGRKIMRLEQKVI